MAEFYTMILFQVFYFQINVNLSLFETLSLSAQRDKYVCFPSPFWVPGKLCLKFYDLNFKKWPMSGCVDVAAFLVGKELPRIKLGCFEIAENYKYFERDAENQSEKRGIISESYQKIKSLAGRIGSFGQSSNETSS